MVGKANNKLSCIMRNTKEFKKGVTYIKLYLSLVRSSLIYASPVWNPHHKIYSDEIERVQHRFLRSYSYRFATPMEFNDHNYKTVSKCTDISPLASFRSYQYVLCISY